MPRKRKEAPRNRFRTAVMSRVCVVERCRATYPLTAKEDACMKRGMCPKCEKALRDKRPWLVDPAIYAECQRIAARERRLATWGSPKRKRLREASVLRRLERKPVRIGVLTAEAYLSDGYAPSADTGKRGGPSGKD